MKIVNVKGHDQAVISLLNGDVDAAAVFNDARTVVKDQPNVFKDTKILKLTKPILMIRFQYVLIWIKIPR